MSERSGGETCAVHINGLTIDIERDTKIEVHESSSGVFAQSFIEIHQKNSGFISGFVKGNVISVEHKLKEALLNCNRTRE